MENRPTSTRSQATVIHPQYCCWIELRLGCRIIGFLIIIEAFILLGIHPSWDTNWNVAFSLVSGTVLIVGSFSYNKYYLQVYLCTEIIHIIFMLIVAVKNALGYSKIKKNLPAPIAYAADSGDEQCNLKPDALYLVFAVIYSLFIVWHIYVWICAHRLYNRYKRYRFMLRNTATR